MDIEPERAATMLNLAVAYLGRSALGDVDRAIIRLSEVLDIQPDYASAYVNRASAYIARGGPGDVGRAFEDLDEALNIEPVLPSTHLMLGNAYVARRQDGDLQLAVSELSRAIELSPDWPAPYFNRGLVHSELGNWDQSLSDLARAQELSPREVSYNSTLCLQLAVTGQADAGLPYCHQAVADELGSLSRDTQGLANALTGQTEAAIADFDAFLEWVEASPKQSCRAHYRASRTAWVQSLRAGDNPFDRESLVELRARPAPPGAAPC